MKKCTNQNYTFNSPYNAKNGIHITEWFAAYCGNCGHGIEEARFYQHWKYCPYCGVRIDWRND